MLQNKTVKVFLFFIISVHLFLLTKLIFFPFPELFIYPYLTNHGLKPYSQILDQHFPGLMFLPINLDNLGMNDENIARLWLMGIVFVTHLLLFIISKLFLKSSKKALVVSFLYLIWQPFFEGWVLWIDTFLPILLLPAFYFLHKSKLFLTGLLIGLSIVFKQVLLPLAGLIFIYIFWEKRNLKSLINYSAGVLLPILLMLLYFFSIGVLVDFWYWAVIFNLTVYAQSGRGLGPTVSHLIRVTMVFGTSFITLLRIKEKEAQILIIFLVGTLFSLSTRFDFVHFQPILPFALISTVYGVEKIGKKMLIKILGLGYVMITIWWLSSFYKGYIGDKVFFFDSETIQIAEKIKQYTIPGEKVFVFGGAPHLYQMSDTLPAGDIFIFQFPWFFEVSQQRILEGIKKDQTNIIVYDSSSKIEESLIIEFGKVINEYILANYEKIDQVGQTQILRKK